MWLWPLHVLLPSVYTPVHKSPSRAKWLLRYWIHTTSLDGLERVSLFDSFHFYRSRVLLAHDSREMYGQFRKLSHRSKFDRVLPDAKNDGRTNWKLIPDRVTPINETWNVVLVGNWRNLKTENDASTFRARSRDAVRRISVGRNLHIYADQIVTIFRASEINIIWYNPFATVCYRELVASSRGVNNFVKYQWHTNGSGCLWFSEQTC